MVPDKKTKQSKQKKDKKATCDLKLSQDGNKAHSFKSVTSYVLGDLDITKDDDEDVSDEADAEELGSFDISSNTSAIHSEKQSSSPQPKDGTPIQGEFLDGTAQSYQSGRNNSSSKQGPKNTGKRFSEDKNHHHAQPSSFLNETAYRGFIAE